MPKLFCSGFWLLMLNWNLACLPCTILGSGPARSPALRGEGSSLVFGAYSRE